MEDSSLFDKIKDQLKNLLLLVKDNENEAIKVDTYLQVYSFKET